MLKRYIGVLLCVTLVAVLFGCASGEPVEIPAADQPLVEDEAILPDTQRIGSPHYIYLDDLQALHDAFAVYAIPMAIGISWGNAYEIFPEDLIRQYGLNNIFPIGAVVYEDFEWETGTFFDPLIDEEVEFSQPFYMRNAEQLEQEIQRHFDVSADHLRSSRDFEPEREAYRFWMTGEGGGLSELVRAEFDSEANLLVLYFEVVAGFSQNPNYRDMHEINVNRLAIRLREGGTGDTWILPVSGDFMFLSNESWWILRCPETGEEVPTPNALAQLEDSAVIYVPDDGVVVDFIPGDGPTLFVPDWEGIVRRAQEIDAFLEQYMTREWIEQELGVAPTRVYSWSSLMPFYRYDLMTEPGYLSPSVFKEDIDFYGLLAGRVGIIVLVTYDDNGGAWTFEVWHPTAYGAVRHHPGAWGGQGWENRYAIAWHRIFPEPPSAARTAEITQRADRLSGFLQLGLSREAVWREMGMAPVVVNSASSGLLMYRFDLMAVPGYDFHSDVDEADLEGLRAGNVGITVFVDFDSNDAVDWFSFVFYLGESNFLGRDSQGREIPFRWSWDFVQ